MTPEPSTVSEEPEEEEEVEEEVVPEGPPPEIIYTFLEFQDPRKKRLNFNMDISEFDSEEEEFDKMGDKRMLCGCLPLDTDEINLKNRKNIKGFTGKMKKGESGRNNEPISVTIGDF